MHHHPRNRERAINLSILSVSGPDFGFPEAARRVMGITPPHRQSASFMVGTTTEKRREAARPERGARRHASAAGTRDDPGARGVWRGRQTEKGRRGEWGPRAPTNDTPKPLALPPGARGEAPVLPEKERQRGRPSLFLSFPWGRARRGTGRARRRRRRRRQGKPGEPGDDRAPPRGLRDTPRDTAPAVPPTRTHGPQQRAPTGRSRGRRPRKGRTGPAASIPPKPGSRQAHRHGTGSRSGGGRKTKRTPASTTGREQHPRTPGEAREGTEEEAGGRPGDRRGTRELGGRALAGRARPPTADRATPPHGARAAGTDRTRQLAATAGPTGGRGKRRQRTAGRSGGGPGARQRQQPPGTARRRGPRSSGGRTGRQSERETRSGRQRTDGRNGGGEQSGRAEKSAPAATPAPAATRGRAGEAGEGEADHKEAAVRTRRRCRARVGGASPAPETRGGGHKGSGGPDTREEGPARKASRGRPGQTRPPERARLRSRQRHPPPARTCQPPRGQSRAGEAGRQATGERDTLQRGGATQRPSVPATRRDGTATAADATCAGRARVVTTRAPEAQGPRTRPGHRENTRGNPTAQPQGRSRKPRPGTTAGPVSREPAPQNLRGGAHTPPPPARTARTRRPPGKPRPRQPPNPAATARPTAPEGGDGGRETFSDRDRPPETPFRVPTAPHGRAQPSAPGAADRPRDPGGSTAPEPRAPHRGGTAERHHTPLPPAAARSTPAGCGDSPRGRGEERTGGRGVHAAPLLRESASPAGARAGRPPLSAPRQGRTRCLGDDHASTARASRESPEAPRLADRSTGRPTTGRDANSARRDPPPTRRGEARDAVGQEERAPPLGTPPPRGLERRTLRLPVGRTEAEGGAADPRGPNAPSRIAREGFLRRGGATPEAQARPAAPARQDEGPAVPPTRRRGKATTGSGRPIFKRPRSPPRGPRRHNGTHHCRSRARNAVGLCWLRAGTRPGPAAAGRQPDTPIIAKARPPRPPPERSSGENDHQTPRRSTGAPPKTGWKRGNGATPGGPPNTSAAEAGEPAREEHHARAVCCVRGTPALSEESGVGPDSAPLRPPTTHPVRGEARGPLAEREDRSHSP
ncbi:collagen alpha-1(I) chain-like [Suncus etruscus]|uniref:collagen alpha-1(I) chain-like n=1 Tax=Suncus etruscus TaxID=109475 RepID=UPI0021106DCB|nr:collagen alpha-1(I) chain-like [Suncus etruscus]